MLKDEMSAIISNLKLNMSSSKISSDAIKGFSMLTINNKHAKNAPILQFTLRASAGIIGIPSHSSCWGIENPDANNESNENQAETRIELEDEINQDKLICQTKRANN